jgi:hypothetical protein
MAGVNGNTGATLQDFATLKREVFPQVRKALKKKGIACPSEPDLFRVVKAIRTGESVPTQTMLRSIAAIRSLSDAKGELERYIAPAPKPEEKKPEGYKPPFMLEDETDTRLKQAAAICSFLMLYEQHSDEFPDGTAQYAAWAARDLLYDVQNYIAAHETGNPEEMHTTIPYTHRVTDPIEHFHPALLKVEEKERARKIEIFKREAEDLGLKVTEAAAE